MRFPKIIQNKKTKAEVTIYGKSKGGERKMDNSLTQPYPFYRVCWRVAGQRRMKSFGTYSAALKAADKLLADLGKGSQVTALTPGQAHDALAALERLEGFHLCTGRRLSLLATVSAYCEAAAKLKETPFGEAIDGYLSNVASVKRKDILEAAEQFIEVRRPLTVAKEGKRPQLSAGYTYNWNMWLREFAKTFPGSAVCDLTRDHLALYFSKYGELGVKSRNERRGVVRMFLQWSVRQDYLPVGSRLLEADCMAREVYEPGEIGFYTAEELRAMLSRASQQPGTPKEGLAPEADFTRLLPVLALCALAGVRLQEAVRLTWEDVFRVAGHVEISSGKSKTRSRRLVTVCPALAAWLKPYRNLSGPIWTECIDKLHSDINALLGSLDIPAKRNGLRHGFCTNHFGLYSNENLTAAMAGNSPQIIHSHYKGLVTRKEAAKWFTVRPAKAAANIVDLPAAQSA